MQSYASTVRLGDRRWFERAIPRRKQTREAGLYGGIGAGGGTRTPTGLPPTDFRTSFGFRRPSEARRAKEGSWSGLSLHPAPAPGCVRTNRGLGAARLVSTPSRFRAWLGIAVERFPRVWAVLRPRFPAAHSNAQVRCVCHSATPAWRRKLYPRRRESPRQEPGITICAPHNARRGTSGSVQPAAFAIKPPRVYPALAPS